MSIASEIQRIQNAKTGLVSVLANAGFEVSSSDHIEDLVNVIDTEVDLRNDTPLDVSIYSGHVGEICNISVNLPENATGTVRTVVCGTLITASVTSGTAKFNIPITSSGVHTATVEYDGDEDYKPSCTWDYLEVTKVTLSEEDFSLEYTPRINQGEYLELRVTGMYSSDMGGEYGERVNIGEGYTLTSDGLFVFDAWSDVLGFGNMTDGMAIFGVNTMSFPPGNYTLYLVYFGNKKYTPVVIEFPLTIV